MPRAVSSWRHGRRNRRPFRNILLHHSFRINLITGYCNDSLKSLRPYPCPTPSEEVTRIRLGRIHRYHAVGGANGTTIVVMFVGLLCWGLWYFPYYSYCRNPRVREFFVPAGTLIEIKLLTELPLLGFGREQKTPSL